MKHRYITLLFITIILSFTLVVFFTANAKNYVLQLDGDSDYVELASNIFNDLDEATVEGWAKLDSFFTYSRFFEFGKREQAMVVDHDRNGATLQFYTISNDRPQGGSFREYIIRGGAGIKRDGLFRLNQWVHIAAMFIIILGRNSRLESR